MSLLSDLQQITERTYQQWSGIKLEDFIIGKQRFAHLADLGREENRELSEVARVFFRTISDQLYLAIYFSESLIAHLERHDPRRGLTEKNITPFMIFIEEINHGLHAAIKFQSGQHEIQEEEFIRDLELQAKVDTYLIVKFFLAYFNPTRRLEHFDRLWLRHHLFERGNYHYRSQNLRYRYEESNWLGGKYARFVDSIPPEDRLQELRQFRAMDYHTKSQYIRLLP